MASSIERVLDCEWSDPEQKTEVPRQLVMQFESLQQWIEQRLSAEIGTPPLKDHLQTLHNLLTQNLETGSQSSWPQAHP
jgi:hypothetical protein